MNIQVVYLHIMDKEDEYLRFSKRFAATYKQFEAGYPHVLKVVCCNSKNAQDTNRYSQAMLDVFSPIAHIFDCYTGGGMDIGAHQYAASNTHCDWMVFCSSHVYFHRSGWLKKMVWAFNQYGKGMYGAIGSYEESEHLRTCFYACKPNDFRSYPFLIKSRMDALNFEHGPHSFTRWCEDQNKPVVMVAWYGCYLKSDWRKPDNIFRRGDQSNILIRDRHTDVYSQSPASDKRLLESITDGKGWPT